MPTFEREALESLLIGLLAVAPNCGAGRTSAEPLRATWPFRWPRFAIEPRGIPMPAEPLFTINRVGGTAETAAPPLPTTTVPTLPVGLTGGWKTAGVVPM